MASDLSQPRRSNQRAATVLQFILLFLMMALSGLIGVLWFGGERLLFPPTPTPTATAGVRLSPTGDFRATRIAEDMATQEAYSTLAVQLGLSPLVAPTKPIDSANDTHLPVVIGGDPGLPATTVASTEIGAGNSPSTDNGNMTNIALPVVANGSFLPTPTETPIVFSELPTAPVESPPTETPTETPFALPSDTPTLPPPTETPSPTPTLYFASSQQAYITAVPVATLRAGPSTLYGVVGTLNNGASVRLSSRDETGEWVVACCLPNNVFGWVRQVYAPPRDNVLPTGVPTSVTPNDVRWLKVEAAPPNIPIMTPTLIPDNSYPHYRHDRGNNGRVAQLPTWPLTPVWPNPSRADQPMTSPIVVANGKVIVASADNHLYAFDLEGGNQQWRFNVGARVNFAPAVQDNFIYFADEQGRLFGIQDVGNQANITLGPVTLSSVPQSSLYLAGSRLFLITRSTQGNQDYQLHFIDRGNGSDANYTSATMAPFLAVGNQLVYAGVPALSAFDINERTLVWTNTDIQSLTAPPVFVVNGPRAMAELYVADNQGGGRVHAVDANTGVLLWTAPINREVTGIVVNDTAVFVTGEGFMRALPRQAGNSAQLWDANVAGRPIGGPWIDGNQLLVVTVTGQVQGINFSGGIIGNAMLAGNYTVIGAPAVSGAYLYIPTNNSIVSAFRGQP